MAFDPVPLAIGGGAVHSDNVMRVASNIFSRDSQGIRRPGDFKVTAAGGGSVSIAPGGMVLVNAQNAGESYVGSAPTPTTWNSGMTAAGSHLLVARVVDPEFAPWQPSGTPGAPNTSVPNGPYFQPWLIPGVGTGTTTADQVVSYTAEALARIDNPSGAATITSAMVKDLRRLAQPRVGFAFDVQRGPATPDYIAVADTAYAQWPLNSISVYVPKWATHAQVSVSLLNVYHGNTPANFEARVWFGGLTSTSNHFDWNGSTLDPIATTPHVTYGEFDVQSLQGQTVTTRLDVRREFTFATGDIWFEQRGQVVFDVRFSERAV